MKFITIPFGYLLDFLYQFTQNYGLALILFAVLVKVIMLPITAKSKRSTMKMSRMAPRLKAIQDKYADDPVKQNAAIQALYKEEGVSLGGGCLWSLVPILILIPLYNVVREPLVYLFHGDLNEVVVPIMQALKGESGLPAILPEGTITTANKFYEQMIVAPLLPQYAEQLKAQLPEIFANPDNARLLEGLHTTLFGIELAKVPSYTFWQASFWNLATIGAFLIPVLSAGSQVLSMVVSMKLNNSLVTNEKGLQDKETAKSSQANQTNKTMMILGPVMSLWIGFSTPAALSVYWLVQGLITMVIDVLLTMKYRKVYDAEDAIRLEKALEEERIEAEKERVRAERRAANPDGITENTSKKKLQQKQQREQEAAKAAAKKEYDAKKGIVEEDAPKKQALSGIPERPYCKGRAYDPNRYSSETTEE